MIKNKLLSNILIYGGITGVSRMLPLILLPFYLSVISITDFGRIEVLISLYNLLIIFGSLQMETAIQRYMYHVENKVNFTYTICIIILILSVITSIIVSMFSTDLSILLFESDSQSRNIIIIAINTVLFNISTILLIHFRYTDKEKIFSILTLSQVIISSVVTYILVVIEKTGIQGYIIGLGSGWLFVLIVSLPIIFRKQCLAFETTFIKKSFDFSIPQIPARFGSFFVQFGNRFVTLALLGAQSVAILGVANKFAAIFQLIYIAFNMAWNPYLYKNENNENLEKNINVILKYLIITIITLFALIHFLGSFIIDYFFNKEYEDVKKYIILAVIPSSMLIIKEILETGIRLSNKTKYISYSYFVSAGLMFFLMIVSKNLVDIFLSSIVSTTILLILSWFYSEKTYKKIKFQRKFLILFLFIIIIIPTYHYI